MALLAPPAGRNEEEQQNSTGLVLLVDDRRRHECMTTTQRGGEDRQSVESSSSGPSARDGMYRDALWHGWYGCTVEKQRLLGMHETANTASRQDVKVPIGKAGPLYPVALARQSSLLRTCTLVLEVAIGRCPVS